MKNRYELEQELFVAAIALPPAEWRSFLAGRTDDPDLRGAVEDLLREHEENPGFLARAALATLAGEARAAGRTRDEESPGATIGNYRLIEKLGEGGYGAVYRAEQTHPVRREVALKIIKLGMDTRAVVARFEAERQALAMMEHPNIAQVFDAGATESGRPFFVMELVRGTRITDYCDEHALTIRERLELFRRVCDALQHAHQKGVIHRDLKPSNILVAGPEGIPKIIDFGIAKATQGRLANETILTMAEELMGTPAYMSPEQADRQGEVVDTRSDVYSLGVVLYELLTGSTPLAGMDIRQVGVEEVRRRIREVEPTTPTSRVRAFDETTLGDVAGRRRSSPGKFRAMLTADLDGVVMKCLQKDPARRYESASALAQDLERYLNGHPVAARSAGQWYVWGKFIRRHRLAFGAAVAIVLLLTVGLTVSIVLLVRERAARMRALAAEQARTLAQEAAEKASRQARTEATRSVRVTQFMTSMLNGVGPAAARGRDTQLLRELLDDATARLGPELRDEPEVEADLREVIGDVLWLLSEHEASEKMQLGALALREQALGPGHPKVANSLMRIGVHQNYHGSGIEAERTYRRAMEIRRQALGPEDPATADAMQSVGQALTHLRRFAEARAITEAAAGIQRRRLAPGDQRLLRTEATLAGLMGAMGNYSEAIRMCRDIIARYPDDTRGQEIRLEKSAMVSAMAGYLHRTGRVEEAIAADREFVALTNAEGHRNGVAEVDLARELYLAGRFEEAMASLPAMEMVRALAQRENLGRFNDAFVAATSILGACLVKLGRHAEAEAILRESCSRAHSPNIYLAPHPVFALQTALAALGRPAEAEAALTGALEQAKRDESVYVFELLPHYHRLLLGEGRRAEAQALILDHLAFEREVVARRGEEEAGNRSLAVLAAVVEAGESPAIERAANERFAWWDAQRPTDRRAHAYRALRGEVLLAQGRFGEAEEEIVRASEALSLGYDGVSGEEAWLKGRLGASLARLYSVTTRVEDPARWRQFVSGRTLDPRWEFGLAQSLAAAGRFQETLAILSDVTDRARAGLAQEPDSEPLAALVPKVASLREKCLAGLGRLVDLLPPGKNK